MARRGEYRLSSGEPPFTPGIEGGGVIVAVGDGVRDRQIGQRVILTIGAPAGKGTYRSQFAALATETVPVPDEIPGELIGALWVYGLLGAPDTVDVSPLIRKDAAIRGWLLNTIARIAAEHAGYQNILDNVASDNCTFIFASESLAESGLSLFF